jgi:hypothetical protein
MSLARRRQSISQRFAILLSRRSNIAVQVREECTPLASIGMVTEGMIETVIHVPPMRRHERVLVQVYEVAQCQIGVRELLPIVGF